MIPVAAPDPQLPSGPARSFVEPPLPLEDCWETPGRLVWALENLIDGRVVHRIQVRPA
ncbi:MAG TPA: hypothetical protein VMV57_01180 [Terracidiphilus sp.]|nr:hypothetical protein [Terracidiphilus sp.]